MDLMKIITLVKNVLMMLAPSLKKADSTHGIKELSEAVDGALLLGLVIAERLKDGVGIDDLGALWDRWRNDQEVQDKLKAAVDNYKAIGDEVGDMDLGEGLEITCLAVDYVPKYVEALKKPVEVPVEEEKKEEAPAE